MIARSTNRNFRLPITTLVVTAPASLGGLTLTLTLHWPLWAVGVAAVLPWLPLFTFDIVVTYSAVPVASSVLHARRYPDWSLPRTRLPDGPAAHHGPDW